MKKARANIVTAWPVEGLSLREALRRLAGDAAFSAYIRPSDAPMSSYDLRRLMASSLFGAPPPSPAEQQRIDARKQAYDQIYRACWGPLLDAWNQGELVAACRRGDPLATPMIIPPPEDSWFLRVVDLDRSIIRDPAGRGRGKLFDLRFFKRDAVPVPASSHGLTVLAEPSQPVAEAKPDWSAKQWLADEVKLTPPPVDRGHGWKTAYAKKIWTQMMEAAKEDPCIKPCKTAKALATKLYDYKLWPE